MKPNVGYQKCLAKLKSDLIVATGLSSMIGSFAMGLFANLPLGLAPGMDPNTFPAYNLVGFHGSGSMSCKTAMTVVLVEGCAFPAIPVFGIRAKLARLIPKSVRLACAAGIGLFIAFVGLQAHQGLGLIGPDPAMLVTVAACKDSNPTTGECIGGKMQSPTFWLGSVGFLIICYGLMKNVKGSMIYGMLFVTLVSWIRGTRVTIFPYTSQGDSNYEYFKKYVDFHKIESTLGAISFTNFVLAILKIQLQGSGLCCIPVNRLLKCLLTDGKHFAKETVSGPEMYASFNGSSRKARLFTFAEKGLVATALAIKGGETLVPKAWNLETSSNMSLPESLLPEGFASNAY